MNRRVTIDEVAEELNISRGSTHHIIHEILQYHKVSDKRVPKQVTLDLKERHVGACETLLRGNEAEGNYFFRRIVTGDECWVHYAQAGTKQASKERRHTTSPRPKTFKTAQTVGKLTVFRDHEGPVVEHYMPKGPTVNNASFF
ncbi:MAG: hypothetical protein PV344_00425 [Anaplasma sp.]|nr:hypothetical protein [Anaplasma sp.]